MPRSGEGVHWMIRLVADASKLGRDSPLLDPTTEIEQVWQAASRLSSLGDAELAARVAEHFGLKVADFDRAERHATRFVPERLARTGGVFPLRVGDRDLVVATSDPLDLDVEEQLRFVSGRTPVFEIAPPAAIGKMVDAHYHPESAAERLLNDIGAEGAGLDLVEEFETPRLDETDASGEPIVRLSNMIIREGIKQRASDIHLAPGRSLGTVHVRVDGVLQLRMRVPMPVFNRVVSRVKIMGRMDIADRLRPQDGRARIRVDNAYYDLRISTVPTRDAEKAVIRLLYSDTARRIDDLGLPAADFERLRSMLAHRDSIVVVTGPTGSGKTTTLYAVLEELNTGDVNIMTVEDPVEYELPGVTQIQVEPRRGVTFASALRAILRQDPDIILLGEIRDGETAEIAVQAAQTGHLVLATLHTNEAVGAVSRLHDLGLPPASISDALCGIVAQRLVRTLCTKCSVAIHDDLTETETTLARRYGVQPTRRAVGCPACNDTGYHGRVPVIETVVLSPSLRQLINRGASIDALRKDAIDGGMQPLPSAALDLVRSGVTDLEEVERALGEPARPPAPAAAQPAPRASDPVGDEMPRQERRAADAGTGVGEGVRSAADSLSAGSRDAPRQGEPLRVLLADDDPVVRQVARVLLSKTGFTVIEVPDGVAALERLNSGDPDDHIDLLIADLDMPRLNGYDLLRLTRSSARTAALPIIVLTGEEDPDAEARLIDEGADDYIRKPIEPERFLARVKSALRRAGV